MKLSYLNAYLEGCLLEMMEALESRELQREWFHLFLEEDGSEKWEGRDCLKDEVKKILDWLDLREDFRNAVWHSIDFYELMEAVIADYKEWLAAE